MVKAIFFDLFFTLADPRYADENEYDVMGISAAEWERYAEDDVLYRERALGRVKTEKEIIDRIVDIMPYFLSESQKQEIQKRREARMKRAFMTVDHKILDTLMVLRNKSIKIGLISNADIIDSKYWNNSPLSGLFDGAVFSCDVGFLKPDIEIYKIAMDMQKVKPEESVFVGDGGSDELYGAKRAGMKTVFSEYLERKPSDKAENIMLYADYHINDFDKLLTIIK